MHAPSTLFRHQTRATEFQQRFQYPEGFPDLLKDFTRECLREQPPNILPWASQYFTRLAINEPAPLRASGDGGAPAMLPDTLDSSVVNDLRDLESQIVELLGTERLSVDIARRRLQDHFSLPPDHVLYFLSLCSDDTSVNARAIDPSVFASIATVPLYHFCDQPVTFETITHEGGDAIHGHLQGEIMTVLLQGLLRKDAHQSGRPA